MSKKEQIPEEVRKHSTVAVVVATLVVVAFLFVFFLGALRVLQYTETSAFCGLCHNVMDPEVTTHEISPHANVECGTCHVGPGTWARIWYHARNVRYVWRYPLGQYEKPLPTPLSTLRPAQVVCEQCHWPAKFYPIQLRTLHEYAPDEANSLTRMELPMKVGSSEEKPEGYGPGIHWHIEEAVYYIATDENRQQIPWVQVETDGETREFMAVDADLTQDQLDRTEKRRMDCMDCHNRVTHIIQRPADALDQALAKGQIAVDLPYIKEQGTAVLTQTYASQTEAMHQIAAVANFYRTNYPNIYAERPDDIRQAVDQLQRLYQWTQFPFMNATWQSYPDNIGHRYFPGCFRCHDGKHVDAQGRVLRTECRLCHAIPQVAHPGEPLPGVSLAVREIDPSHESTLWLAEHPYTFNNVCDDCHTVANPGGADDSSFCSNSACHGIEWTYLDTDAEAIQARVRPNWPIEFGERPPAVQHPLDIGPVCDRCHGRDQILPYPADHVPFSMDDCAGCHLPTEEPSARLGR
ncbi:MAG: NapC/NirT family cytochrome c [Anaerolineae bacterium]|jgi:nitrate/TMAO reductase-like tetraheme cytochrome c subunit